MMATPASIDTGPRADLPAYHAGVRRYLRVLGCGIEEAEELTQEVFARVLEGPFRHRTAGQSWRYLLQAARWTFLRHRERQQRVNVVAWTNAVDEWYGRHAEVDGGGAWIEALRHCTDRLTGRPRAAVDLFYVRGLGRREVARRLGMKETGVKTLLQRIRARLRACIEEQL